MAHALHLGWRVFDLGRDSRAAAGGMADGESADTDEGQGVGEEA